MKIRGLTAEDFVNYKKPSMYIAFPYCTFKCEKECGIPGICQNCTLAKAKIMDVDPKHIVDYYIHNPITKAIVFAGLEPLDSFGDMLVLIDEFRKYTNDDIIIYTGYNKDEILSQLDSLKEYSNIIIKFGRFRPNQIVHYDEVLGIYLVSDNQYAEKIS